ncbi:putative cAMP phosphodiesterase class-II [Rosellinia necatrix]|uniref:Putative cAMP phosphodiesterase class-II n=1 Tax=Rosellinia necatrix TaxID=77044 RepID=A0A1W2TN52_ROSNE|nr:putative cAMP phosphodiesterase class-II [Rosellinia necatrix]
MSRRVEDEDGARAPAIQVIVLGAGGGPQEHNVTALLVRSLATGWSKGSVIALDAGVHLSSITRILEQTQPPGLGTSVSLPHTLQTGPFAGLEIASASATTNAGHVTRHLIDTFLITHPHLDHISGFVINTAGLPGARPKRLAGLPSTISAFKQHIFNNVIWPNLSDENNGAGLVTYMRLVEGGSPALGEGDGKGYLEITDGLAVKLFSVSHGHCIERHPHRGSSVSSRFGSFDASSLAASPRGIPGSTAASGPPSLFRTSAAGQDKEALCVYDSSAYFIRDGTTGREVLMFGDVEPDAISLTPRNSGIWQEAAPRIANGNLAAIFIECSYDNSQTDDCLFGHLTPRYIIREMQALAAAVEMVRHAHQPRLDPPKKRKRDSVEITVRIDGPGTIVMPGDDHPVSPKSMRPTKKGPSSMAGGGSSGAEHSGANTPHIETPTAEMSLKDLEANTPPVTPALRPTNTLRGLKVVIIHVKERLVDGEAPRDAILAQLLEAEAEAQLGCQFVVSSAGQSFLL